MKHVKAIAIKFIACLGLLWLILGGIYGIDFGDIFMISLVLGVASYFIGDMIILPLTNNLIASLADFGLALGLIWIMSDNMTPQDNLFTPALVSAIGVTIFEYFYHKYIANHVLHEDEKRSHSPAGNLRYQTESSDELTDVMRKAEEENEK
ncbi:YndM family protein [Salinibacillus xinjiangensis]|uniref:DUF2512 family protein n=1 Tax=Salinibacillus xinjiangensis TaxID=1229268 RepID=A0A6G1X284_9BACI|nr:YndM family protein [Salinibacillus xinjiangensis]MRG85107.1 DUF2512 family protein [Salinibacillus xinjiangensis]